jgi:hypothetical protein
MKLNDLNKFQEEMFGEVRAAITATSPKGADGEQEISILVATFHAGGIEIAVSEDLQGDENEKRLARMGIASTIEHLVSNSAWPVKQRGGLQLDLAALLAGAQHEHDGEEHEAQEPPLQ